MLRSFRLPTALHYGWVVVLAGTLTIFACLGLARFALGMLLPGMQASLALSKTDMGLLGSANFVGYLAAVVLCGRWVRRIGSRRLIVGSLLVIAGSMAVVSQADSFPLAVALYLLTGMGSGAANVPTMALVSRWFAPAFRGRAAGFIVSGSGFAIVFSGILIPRVNDAFGEEGWRTSWLILGGVSVLVAALGWRLLREDPSELGLEPVGAAPVRKGGGGAAAKPPSRRRILSHLGLLYFLFGSTYIVYATFFVTTLVRERGFTEPEAGALWAWVGALSLLSGPVFGGLSDRIGRPAGLLVVFASQAAAYLLVAADLPEGFLWLSAVLYGVVVWGVPSIMAAAAGDYMGTEHAAAALGLVTLCFGFGQIIGPGVAGVLADHLGSFSASYLMAGGLAGAAVVLAIFLPRPHPSP